MATFDNSYSRFVAFAKIVLPLAALALLSTLFLLSRSRSELADIPFSDVDVQQIAAEQRLSSPSFAGVTNDGATVAIEAVAARPDPDRPQRVTAETMSATIVLPGGTEIWVDAPTGIVDASDGIAVLDGGVTIETSSGITLNTERLDAELASLSIAANQEVRGTSPLGKLRSGSMLLTREDHHHVLVFKDRVDLVYEPAKRGSE